MQTMQTLQNMQDMQTMHNMQDMQNMQNSRICRICRIWKICRICIICRICRKCRKVNCWRSVPLPCGQYMAIFITISIGISIVIIIIFDIQVTVLFLYFAKQASSYLSIVLACIVVSIFSETWFCFKSPFRHSWAAMLIEALHWFVFNIGSVWTRFHNTQGGDMASLAHSNMEWSKLIPAIFCVLI